MHNARGTSAIQTKSYHVKGKNRFFRKMLVAMHVWILVLQKMHEVTSFDTWYSSRLLTRHPLRCCKHFFTFQRSESILKEVN